MKQRHRIFIAINLPDDIRKKLVNFQKKWPELPIRWTKPDNIHITLIFLGDVNNEQLPEICKVVKEAASRHAPFFVNLNKVYYGPPNKMPPRMIWVSGEKSQSFASLKDDLDKLLLESNGVHFSPENRSFSPHITLGRIRQWEWRMVEPEERPEVSEEISLSFPVNSIEVMESELKKGGAEYIILESCNLSGKI